jgi:hypothetical protein
MARRLRFAALVLGLCAVSGCGFGATVGVDEVSLSAATLRGSAGALEQDFQGNWWFEYWGAGESGTHSTTHQPFSARAGEQVPVSARITGLEQLGEPVLGLTRVRRVSFRTCVGRDSPAYGPLCSEPRQFQSGDYVFGSVAFQGADYGMFGPVAAESGPGGEEATGRVDLDTLFGTREDIRGPVTCLRVSGHRAVMAVDNESGTDVLLYFHADGNGAMFLAPPPPNLSACPDPTVPAGVSQSYFGGLPEVSDGP